MNNPVRKIFNDPIYGFVTIPGSLCFRIIEHPYFQRLRMIKQLGATHLVYPGALHNRFHHAIGAMHLMDNAIAVLRSKGVSISEAEAESSCAAILLHDVGHSPYSHSLEFLFTEGLSHEALSSILMKAINRDLGGRLDEAIAIFEGSHPKRFLHQLVSGQIDVDRLDYLQRDSFYTGVSEGVISTDRIIAMLNVSEGHLAVEVKGIYSVEKFLIARRLMYWQVYLHKTVIAAEKILVNILKRASELASGGMDLFASPALRYFLYVKPSAGDMESSPEALAHFTRLDDSDIYLSIKVWMESGDKILAALASAFVKRNLYRIKLQDLPFDKSEVKSLEEEFAAGMKLGKADIPYFVSTGVISNRAYNPALGPVNILYRDGRTVDIREAADLQNIAVLAGPVEKHFLYCPKTGG